MEGQNPTVLAISPLIWVARPEYPSIKIHITNLHVVSSLPAKAATEHSNHDVRDMEEFDAAGTINCAGGHHADGYRIDWLAVPGGIPGPTQAAS